MQNRRVLLCPYDGFKLRSNSPSYIHFMLKNAGKFNLMGRKQLSDQNDNEQDKGSSNLLFPIKGEYEGFKITISETRDNLVVVDIEGSFHKFHQGGKNYKHFYWEDFQEAYRAIIKLFNLDPETVKVVNLEVGLNLYIPEAWHTTPQKIACNILYLNPRKKSSKKDTKEYEDFGFSWCSKHDQYWIKIYDKSVQNFLIQEKIIRLEKRHIKSHPLEKHGIFRMSDLLNYEVVESLSNNLVKTLNKLIIYQIELSHLSGINEDDKSFLLQYCKPEAWQEAHKCRNLFRSVKPRYLKLVKNHCNYDLKNEIIKEMKSLIKSQYSMLAEFLI
jgi:hypothetical protein